MTDTYPVLNSPGLAGVTVRLLDGTGIVLGTTQTGTTGQFAFAGLVPGSYQIEVVAPAGRVISPQDQGNDDSLDSDADAATGRSAVFVLTQGQNNTWLDVGLTLPVM